MKIPGNGLSKNFRQMKHDTVIERQWRKLFPEIYNLDVKKISAKLKSRRDLLSKAGLKYYRFLSKEVNVVGSNKNEYFKIFNKNDSLEIKVYKRKQNNDSSSVMYDRIFDSKTTNSSTFTDLMAMIFLKLDSTCRFQNKIENYWRKRKRYF